MNYQQILEKTFQEIIPYRKLGKQADYIPELAKVNPNQFGMCLRTLNGESFQVGEANVRFSIQSISKVFSLTMGLALMNDDLWSRMGKEPVSYTHLTLPTKLEV